MSLITLTFLTGLDSAVNLLWQIQSNAIQSNPVACDCEFVASVTNETVQIPWCGASGDAVWMADPWLADPWLAAEARSSLKSRGLMCCAACLLVKIRGYSKVNWVHDPASLAGQSIGRGRDEQYSGKIFEGVDNSRSQEEGWMVWGEMFSKVEGGVTDQSGPRADLGADFLQSRLPRSQVSRCLQLLWFWAGAGAGAGLMQRKLPGLARGLRIGAICLWCWPC
jgi:hypothetical protein